MLKQKQRKRGLAILRVMPNASLLRASLLASIAILLPLQGCKSILHHYSSQINADPKIRQQVVQSAVTSCKESSEKAFPQTVPNREAFIGNYCKCFSEEGLGKFTNEELAEIGLTPGHKLTDDQNKKLEAAVNMCIAQTQQQTQPVPAK